MQEVTTASNDRLRNKGYQRSHQQMIDTAIRLISEKGVDALSLAGLAKEMQINRSTIYYHFKSRDNLVLEVKQWSAEQLTRGLDLRIPRQERIDYITRFVLQNPELINLWIEDLVSGQDIEHCYPAWDSFVQGVKQTFEPLDEAVDAEVFCLNLLIGAIITPHVFTRSISPDGDIDSLVQRFRRERLRTLSMEKFPDTTESVADRTLLRD